QATQTPAALAGSEARQEDEEAAVNEHIEQDDGQDIPGVLGDEVAQLDGVRQRRHRTAQKVGRELDQGQDYDGQSTATRQAVDFQIVHDDPPSGGVTSLTRSISCGWKAMRPQSTSFTLK